VLLHQQTKGLHITLPGKSNVVVVLQKSHSSIRCRSVQKKLQYFFSEALVTSKLDLASKGHAKQKFHARRNPNTSDYFLNHLWSILCLFDYTEQRAARTHRTGAGASLSNSGKKRSMGSFVLNLALLAIGIGIGIRAGSGFEQGG
jgi:hypothetical protein